jgi:hypothetical protein
MLDPVLFIAVIVVIACSILGSFYVLCRHTHPTHESGPHKRSILSNWK